MDALQVIVHAVGLVLAVVGLILLLADQLGGRGGGEAGATLLGIKVAGPPALVLTVVGVGVFLFPLTGVLPETNRQPGGGQGTVSVPDVRGDPPEAAIEELGRHDLGVEEIPQPEVADGTCEQQGRQMFVADQAPAPGTPLSPGDAVQIEIACAP